jgi:hypothetical protein
MSMLLLHSLTQENTEDQTVDGAMSQSNMKMDIKVPDALTLEMIHGTVEINMIPLPAHQDGLVILHQENALWPIQEMDLEVNQLVKITALHMDHIQVHPVQILIDAILQLVYARNVKIRLIQGVAQTDLLNATIVPHNQITRVSSNAIRLTQQIQNARNAHLTLQRDVMSNLKLAKAATHHKNYSNVIQRHSPAFRLSNKVISKRPVMLSADTSPHKSSSVPGEVSKLRRVKQRISTWVK